ncbi:MAG: GcrA family cell cycle regulator [Candidatus Bathyarchaeia archaeon]
MPKGKPWTIEEEKQLKDLVLRGFKPADIAAKMGKTKDAVLKKIERIGLKVVQPQSIGSTTTSELIMPQELPSVEEALKLLVAAINALQTPNLSKAEIARLRTIITAVKTYKELLADYINYRQIESKLLEMEQRFNQLAQFAQTEMSQQTP